MGCPKAVSLFISNFKMKKILTYLLIILLSSFVLDFAGSKLLDYCYKNTFVGNNSKVNYVLQKEKFQTIFLGSSRVNHTVNANEISENAFNLGVDGRFISFCAGASSLLDQYKKMPDTLIVHLDLLKLCDSENTTYDGSDMNYLSNYYHSNSYIKKTINEISSLERLKYMFRLYGYNGRALSVLRSYLQSPKKSKAFKKAGYKPKKRTAKDAQKLNYIIEKNKGSKISENQKLNEKAKQAIEKIMSLCEKNNTVLIFFTGPRYQNINAVNDGVRNELATTLNGVPFIDFTHANKQFPALQKPEFWKDLVHVNDEGANLFGKILKQEIAKL